jgi:hypothetical protein
MNFLKSSLTFWAGILVGLLLGAMFSHPRLATAAATGNVRVKRAVVNPKYSDTLNPIQGTAIGFSCVANSGGTECYIATQ